MSNLFHHSFSRIKAAFGWLISWFKSFISKFFRIFSKKNSSIDEIQGETDFEFDENTDKNFTATSSSDAASGSENDQLSRFNENLVRPVNYQNRSLDHENGGKEAFDAKEVEKKDAKKEMVVVAESVRGSADILAGKKKEEIFKDLLKKLGKTGKDESLKDDDESEIHLKNQLRQKRGKLIKKLKGLKNLSWRNELRLQKLVAQERRDTKIQGLNPISR